MLQARAHYAWSLKAVGIFVGTNIARTLPGLGGIDRRLNSEKSDACQRQFLRIRSRAVAQFSGRLAQTDIRNNEVLRMGAFGWQIAWLRSRILSVRATWEAAQLSYRVAEIAYQHRRAMARAIWSTGLTGTLMSSIARCWKPPHAVLAAAMIFLTGCAGVTSNARPSACAPVVAYSPAEQARVAEEVVALPEGAMIPDWLADYAVLRDQARACRKSNAR